MVNNIINPLIAASSRQPNIAEVGTFTINGANFSIGAVLQAIINFLFVAAAVYFVLVAPMNKLMAMRKQGEEPPPEAPSEEILLLTQIRDLLGGADTTVVGPPAGAPGPDDTPPRRWRADHAGLPPAERRQRRGTTIAPPHRVERVISVRAPISPHPTGSRVIVVDRRPPGVSYRPRSAAVRPARRAWARTGRLPVDGSSPRVCAAL